MTTTRPLSRVIDDYLAGGPAQQSEAGNSYTTEIVDAIQDDGRVSVRGRLIPVIGAARGLHVGQRVPVRWTAGVPVVALAPTARRSVFPAPSAPRRGAGVVEQLFIARDPDNDNVWDVWFRNWSICVPLGVAALLEGNESIVTEWGASTIQWGIDGRHFVMRSPGPAPGYRPVFSVWALERDGATVLDEGEVPDVTRVASYDWSTDTTPIASIALAWAAVPNYGLPARTFEHTVTLASAAAGTSWYFGGGQGANCGAFADLAFLLDDSDPPHLIIAGAFTLTVSAFPLANDPSFPTGRFVLPDISWSYGYLYDVTTHTVLFANFPAGGDTSAMGVGPVLSPMLDSVPDWCNPPNNGLPNYAGWQLTGKVGGCILAPVRADATGVSMFVSASDGDVHGASPWVRNERLTGVIFQRGVAKIVARPLGITTAGSALYAARGSHHHVLWNYAINDSDPAPWRLSSLDLGVTQDVEAWGAFNRRHVSIVPPDFLWAAKAFDDAGAAEDLETVTQYMLVEGWDDDGRPTLDATVADYPPADDQEIRGVSWYALAEFPDGVSDWDPAFGWGQYAAMNAFQVVNDPDLLGEIGRYVEESGG